MRVPFQEIPSVQPTAVPLPQQQISSPASAFGGLTAAAEQHAGADLSQASNDLATHALRMAAIDNDTMARDAGMGLAKNMGDAWSAYRQKEGRDAYEGYDGFVKSLQDARTQAIAALPNKQAQKALGDQSAYMVDRWQMTGATYAADQRKVWMNASNKAQQELAGTQAQLFRNQPDVVENWANKQSDAIAEEGRAHGLDADTITANQQISRGSLYKSVIGTLANENPAAAVQMLKSVEGKIDAPTFMALTRELHTKTMTAATSSYVDGAMGGLPHPATTPLSDAIRGTEGSGPEAVSPKGATGSYQVTPGFFKTYAQPGEDFSKEADRTTVALRGIDALTKKYGGDPARVAVGYFSGPGNVAPPDSPTPWIENKSDGISTTSQYVTRTLSRLGGAQPAGKPAPADAFPDESALVTKAMNDWAGNPEMQKSTVAEIAHRVSVLRMETATARDDLSHALPDLQAAALGGQDITIPTDRIRHLMPPADAQRQIEQLQVAQQAGQVFKSIQWGTPDKIQSAYNDLTAGMGPISTQLRGKLGLAPNTDAGTADQDSPEAYRLRTQILHQFEQQVQLRQQNLAADPAGYVAHEPSLQAKAALIDPAKPETAQAYFAASLAVQARLGVPDAQQHILGKAQAQQVAAGITNADPSTADAGSALAKMSREYGAQWPRAFGDLVTLGKLDPKYQTLAQIPDAAVRNDFQRMMMTFNPEKGGSTRLREAAGDQNAKDVEQAVDGELSDFKRTIGGPFGDGNLMASVRTSVRDLALYYTMQGDTGAKAVQRAADGILGAKYDFDGTMRAPKGTMASVQTAAQQALNDLKPADLMPLAADTQATADGPGLTEAQRQEVTLKAAHAGHWYPNENDTGLVLVGQDRDGRGVVMKRADGSRVELNYKGVKPPVSQPMPPMPASMPPPGFLP